MEGEKRNNCNNLNNKVLFKINTIEYYIAVKKKELVPFATVWVDVQIIILGKISQSKKDKYHLTNMWNLLNKIN